MAKDRQHFASRKVFYWEDAVGHIAPLADEATDELSADPYEIPQWMGNGMLNDPTGTGKQMYGGAVPLYQEFEFAPWAYFQFFTADGYLRPGAGTNIDHDFFIVPSGFPDIATVKVQNEWLEGTPVFQRHEEVTITGYQLQDAEVGAPRWSLDLLGIGSDPINTDLAGTKTNNGTPNFNYHHGSLVYEVDGTRHTISREINGWTCNVANGATRREAWYQAAAGSINVGKINAQGTLSFVMQRDGTGPGTDLNFYSDAKNERVIFIDKIQTDRPLSSATKFRRDRLAILVYPRTHHVGGSRAPGLSLPWRLANHSDASWRAEYIAKIAGPYNITAGVNDKLGFKDNGGATVTATLPAGAAVSGQAVVDAINAALAGSAYQFAQRWPTIVSSTKGSSSSVQIDTAVAQSAHALFGFDNVARSGRSSCPILTTFRNARTSDYAV